MPINWDFFNKHVQKGLPHGQYISGRSVLIGAGPPNLAAFSVGSQNVQTDLVYSLGVTQALQINYARNVQRIYEIGSERQYFISGRSMPTLALNRILYHGPNILRILYAHYSSGDPNANFDALLSRYQNGNFPIHTNKHVVKRAPGHENFFIELASDLFAQPLGLLFLIRDEDELMYGAFYAENCYVDGMNMATDSTSIIVTENVTIQAERFVPLSSSVIELVKVLDESVIRKSEEGDLPQEVLP